MWRPNSHLSCDPGFGKVVTTLACTSQKDMYLYGRIEHLEIFVGKMVHHLKFQQKLSLCNKFKLTLFIFPEPGDRVFDRSTAAFVFPAIVVPGDKAAEF